MISIAHSRHIKTVRSVSAKQNTGMRGDERQKAFHYDVKTKGSVQYTQYLEAYRALKKSRCNIPTPCYICTAVTRSATFRTTYCVVLPFKEDIATGAPRRPSRAQKGPPAAGLRITLTRRQPSTKAYSSGKGVGEGRGRWTTKRCVGKREFSHIL